MACKISSLRIPILGIAPYVSILFLLMASASHAANDVDYLRDIKPILKSRCFACHGALKQEAALRLDTALLILKGGESGPAISRGKSVDSYLMERVSAEDVSDRMPPEGEPLTDEQIALLKAWIDQGADAPRGEQPEEDPREHWSFKRPVRAKLSDVGDSAWVRNPIDSFIAAEHQQLGLTPLPPAEKHILMRRVYLDLIGLSPTREQLHAFLADDSPQAYETVVDRLLDSEQYGERWGRHWMDVWRYSDWYGRRQVNDVRNSYPHIWRWRDWIIQSLKNDKGYDQMVREMLAADELYPEDDSRMPALGFIVRNWFSLNYDTWKQDLVEHTGKAFLGLRLNCAHCHDHKYDPISQEEYFQFRAFFEPLELRHDRVPGGPALTKYIRYKPGSGSSLRPIEAGLPRVYDFDFDAPTHMYQLGDARDQMDRPPVKPAAPAILGGDSLEIKQVELPTLAWYPALKPFALEADIKQRKSAIESAETELVKARAAIEPIEQQLATAEQELATAQQKAAQQESPEPKRDATKLIAAWRFEGADDESGFLADSSGHGHTLRRITGKDEKAAPFALASEGTTKAFLDPLPLENEANRQAAEFKQDQSFAYLATDASSDFFANSFTLQAFIHFDKSQRNYNRTIADLDGCWTLLHRGIDDSAFELRLRFFNQEATVRDIATANQKLILKTGRDYYVCLVLGKKDVTFWAADLTSRSPLESVTFPRSTEAADFSALAKPTDGAPFKIGNSDGTGRVDGLIDEVLYSSGVRSAEQIAAAIGQAATDDIRIASANVAKHKGALENARLKLSASELDVEKAKTELAAMRSRIAADQERVNGADKSTEQLAKEAGLAERAAKLSASRAKLANAEEQLAEFRVAPKPDVKKVKQAEKDAVDARKAIASLEKTVEKPTAEFTRLGPEYPKISTGRRRALANWIASPDNPLTARVAVNHIWMRHFGRPIVESVFDFGRSGENPTHPKLLDWLAVELMENNWSMKHIHRLIVTSNTYRMSSRPGEDHANLAIDKDNRFWWKFERRRLEAEIIRDNMLAVSGQLDTTIGGQVIDPKKEAESRRRSLYFSIYPEAGGTMRFMTLFDPPDACDCYRRTRSIVPQQALAMFNSELALKQANELAAKLSTVIAKQSESDDKVAFVQAAFEQVLCRMPSSDEKQACTEFLAKQCELYENSPNKENQVLRASESLIRVLLNHNDFVTIH